MNTEDLRRHMDERFDRMDTKLDGIRDEIGTVGNRTTKNENDINWLRGGAALIVTLLGSIAIAMYEYITRR